nr:hypothetical protein [Shewanella fodinae]
MPESLRFGRELLFVLGQMQHGTAIQQAPLLDQLLDQGFSHCLRERTVAHP